MKLLLLRKASSLSEGVALPPASRWRRSGYSLIEILCVVGVLAMVAAITIPSLFRSRAKSQTAACIDQLRQIHSAQQQWVIESKPKGNSPVLKKDLQPYFKGGKFPVCPSGGDYKLGGPSVTPECSLGKTEGHEL
jgi:prepilin-type N-terminal cleavage/methylation domain-containing protein